MNKQLATACGLSSPQLQVLESVVEEENARRAHLVVYLSGAHAYGFPSPDSDLDLKSIHIAPTEALLGMNTPSPTAERKGWVDNVEVDYTSNELGHALLGILKGNGNFIERILGRTVAFASPALQELQPLVQASLSQRIHRHYRGFAFNQLQFLEKEPTVKKLLYVLRTTLTGIHVLETGEIETDLNRLVEQHNIADVASLIEAKRAGENAELAARTLDVWRPTITRLIDHFDKASEHSVLPQEPTNTAACEAWLRKVRIAQLKD